MNIDRLLAKRHARRVGQPGNRGKARARASLSRQLWTEFPIFDQLRRRLNRRIVRPPAHNRAMTRLVDQIVASGLLRRIPGRNNEFTYRSRGAKRYLTGGWLEELAWLAMVEAGVDEAYFGQEIAWKVNSHEGRNEIDVLARRGDTLSFVSCKTASAYYKGDRRTSEKLKDFLLETHYWDVHFAKGQGRALLVITTDLLDEARADAPRSANIMARATVLDVNVVGRDFFTWKGLVKAMDEHWEPDPHSVL